MNWRLLSCGLFSLFNIAASAQKPAMQFADFKKWPSIHEQKLSNDGKYVSYSVYSREHGFRLFIKGVDGKFIEDFLGAESAMFTSDSHYSILMIPKDTLCIVSLGNNKVIRLSGVQGINLGGARGATWLAYRLTSGDLILRNLEDETERRYPKINNCLFDDQARQVLLIGKDSVQLLVMKTSELRTIWRGQGASDWIFNSSGNGLAFKAPGNIWYYNEGMDSACSIVNETRSGFENGWVIGKGPLSFNRSANKLFFDIGIQVVMAKGNWDMSDVDSTSRNGGPSLDVWSYTDEFLQSKQLTDLKRTQNRTYRVVVSLKDFDVTRLEQITDELWGKGELNEGGDDNYLLTGEIVNFREAYRLNSERPDLYLVNTDNGRRICIKRNWWGERPFFSPGGKYVFWYDFDEKAFLTYNLSNGKTVNVSSRVSERLVSTNAEMARALRPYGVAGWEAGDRKMLIYDRYDVWACDPKAIDNPWNVTSGWGRRHKVSLRYVCTNDQSEVEIPTLHRDSVSWLAVFNDSTKQNGLCKSKYGKKEDPQLMIMADQFMCYPELPTDFASLFKFRKADSAEVYLIQWMTTSEFPNLHVTEDFKHFSDLSDINPQHDINWMTSELVRWRTLDGRAGTGVLYKPENFNPAKKYPVIISMYEVQTNELNYFMEPDYSSGDLNIPWFVSQGYLLLLPDIHYHVGTAGQDAYNYVVSAARMLSGKPWVEGKHIGIHGHSWGGFEVNYIVTHTGMFAAACAAAGPTDFVSDYGSLAFGRDDLHWYLEQEQPRLGSTLWESPDTYIRNSPVFRADKVTTPLLMMHNKLDGTVPWTQGVEFFTALRRLGKVAWLLQYDGSGHNLVPDDARDFTIRVGQFFNHYLKGAPAPIWMIKGVPAAMKGIDSGLEILSDGNRGLFSGERK